MTRQAARLRMTRGAARLRMTRQAARLRMTRLGFATQDDTKLGLSGPRRPQPRRQQIDEQPRRARMNSSQLSIERER